MSDVTVDQNDPALHAVLAPAIGGPDTMPGIALHPDQPALHFNAQEVVGIPLDEDLTAPHVRSGVHPDVAADDDAPPRHL